jgi:hypothetical protein
MGKVVVDWNDSDTCLLKELDVCLWNVRNLIRVEACTGFNQISSERLRKNSDNWSAAMLYLSCCFDVLVRFVSSVLLWSFNPRIVVLLRADHMAGSMGFSSNAIQADNG